MKTAFFAVIAMTALFSAVHAKESKSATAIKADDGQTMSREEFMKLPIEVRRAKFAEYAKKRFGGIVVKKGSAKGWIKFINSQKKVPTSEFERPIKEISKASRVRWEILDGEAATVEKAKGLKEKYKANVAVYVVENAAYPSLLVSPEEGWAIVNVSKLEADNPKPELLASRLRKVCSRAYAYVCGAANISRSGVVMGPVAGLRELDEVPGDLLPRETLVKFPEQLKLFGVHQIVQASYRKACEQGWAPPPADEYQKAIWDEVHAIPDKPIKIKK